MHGLVQSQAVTAAAQQLSTVKELVREGVVGSDGWLVTAKEVYNKALQEYTDPFKMKQGR